MIIPACITKYMGVKTYQFPDLGNMVAVKPKYRYNPSLKRWEMVLRDVLNDGFRDFPQYCN